MFRLQSDCAQILEIARFKKRVPMLAGEVETLPEGLLRVGLLSTAAFDHTLGTQDFALKQGVRSFGRLLRLPKLLVGLLRLTETRIGQTEQHFLLDSKIFAWRKRSRSIRQDVHDILTASLKGKYLSFKQTELEAPRRIAGKELLALPGSFTLSKIEVSLQKVGVNPCERGRRVRCFRWPAAAKTEKPYGEGGTGGK
jgi:hypothetical protein